MDWKLFLSIWVVLVFFSFIVFKEAVGFRKSILKKLLQIFGILVLGPILSVVFLLCSAGRSAIQIIKKPLD